MKSASIRNTVGAVGVLSLSVLSLAVTAQVDQDTQPASDGGAIAMPPGGPPTPGPAPGNAPAAEAPEFPPFETVSKNMEKVISVADGAMSFYTLYANKKDGSLLAELPKDFEGKLIMVAPTIAGGDQEAGVMGGTIYGSWKRIDKSLVLMEPNFIIRSTGDQESQTSIKQLFTERVIIDVPIAAMGPGGGPVIDLKNLFIAQAQKWFTPFFGYGPSLRGMNPRLLTLQSVKAFPQNIEVRYQIPDAAGQLISLHYSVRDLPENPSYKPREADSRVGYFNVYYRDLGKPGADEPYTRYITRWQLEKADPKLKLSPPKQPIVWYIEHTTPVRYRRFVREGILAWNKAFEQCGIVNAVEVYQQDATTGDHMDKDPEDCRFNFFRWNTSEQGYAIGPSRQDPRTGQTLDADVVWHAGLTNAVIDMLKELSGSMATMSFTQETMSWLDEHPEWDPRIRLAPPNKREQLMAQAKARLANGGATAEACDHESHSPNSTCAVGLNGPAWRHQGAACRIGEYLAMNINLFAAAVAGGILTEPAADASTLDGMPEEFLGPMIRYISSHEVGHCLGLQHNFSGSTIRSLKDMNSKEFGAQASVGSVMEYAGVNINFGDGDVQGPYATPTIGPYDMWAIQFGYGPEEDRQKILSRVGEPDLVFHNDMAMMGPDPRAMVWDIGADSLEFCDSRMRIVRDLRGKIISDLVKDGQPWRKARERYISLLGTQMQTIYVAARWIGGSYNNRDFKGDPGNRAFIENVPSDRQRRALNFILTNALRDDAYGLTPDLVKNLGLQIYYDDPGMTSVMMDPSFELHDMVAGVQATALTMILNPTTLRRLYDNEYRTNGSEENPITLAEVMNAVSDSVWSDVKPAAGTKYSAAKPMLSSFRRNLQREHLDRLVTLSLPKSANSPAQRTIATLSVLKLRQIGDRVKQVLSNPANVDEYTLAHFTDAQARIEKALNAQYVITR